jgi:hypothetical protein
MQWWRISQDVMTVTGPSEGDGPNRRAIADRSPRDTARYLASRRRPVKAPPRAIPTPPEWPITPLGVGDVCQRTYLPLPEGGVHR